MKYLTLVFLMVCGCHTNLDRDMIALSQQNETIVKETVAAVSSTIMDELNSRNDLTDQQKSEIQSLLDRLSYMGKSSEVIRMYFHQEKLNVEMIQELIRSGWRKDALQN